MANTLNLGNGNWATKEDSLLAYNSENGNFKPLPFDFTRASSATVVNKANLIETVGSGEPRIDFNNDAKGALLLEPTRTNKFTYSEDYTQWSSLNLTVTSNHSISPSGKQDASFIIPSSGSNEHKIELVPSTQTNSEETFSVYAKPNGFDWLYLRTNINGSWTNGYANFNITTGKTDLLGSGFTSSSIEYVSNGWYRCSVTFSNRGNDALQIFSMPTSQSSSVSNGDGVNGALIYGAQLEEGSYATSYIPTQGSAVTRVADVCNNGGNEQVINSTEGVLYAEVSAFVLQPVDVSISMSDGTFNNMVRFEYYPTIPNQIRAVISVSGANVIMTGLVTNSLILNKIALKWAANDYALWANGVELDTDVTQGTFASNTLIGLSLNRLGANGWYGNVKDLRVYNTALTDTELQALTK